MRTSYDDMIYLPHHVSTAHPQMPRPDRAVQFSPFAALTGYDAAITETGRLTDERIELTEDEKEQIRQRLQVLQEHLSERPEITLTYFAPDGKKSGGAYKSVTGAVKRIDEYGRVIVLHSGGRVSLDEVSQIEGALFFDSYSGA
jgi:hypothetical protein